MTVASSLCTIVTPPIHVNACEQWILSTVNYLNEGHTKLGAPMTANGFRLGCLPQVRTPQSSLPPSRLGLTCDGGLCDVQLKGMSTSGPVKTNLLRFIVMEVETRDPGLLSLRDELAHLRTDLKGT